ncbi:kinase-like domain-containing protein [Glomus cerebriforme]|uniref:Kinase-like domain-containing protein n=1 Tax=Glomus cerebriforme TaxID=658196 RepID=A0A397S901_9GLOM|nr:kinase-like domain-containing protein [Glomus cerebriforme]
MHSMTLIGKILSIDTNYKCGGGGGSVTVLAPSLYNKVYKLIVRLVNQSNVKNDIFGVISYIASEVLRGKPYTKAADIYSFGIIMWEITSGIPAFHNIFHDLNLFLDICKGIRPKIIEGTMPEYVELMKRCWDNNHEKRPTANEFFYASRRGQLN